MKHEKAKPAELRISCRADKKLKKRIASAADSLGVSESDFVRMSVKKFLPDIEKETQPA